MCFLAVAACAGEEAHSPQIPTEEAAAVAPSAAEPAVDKAVVAPAEEGAAAKNEVVKTPPSPVEPTAIPKAPVVPANKAEKAEAPPFDGKKITIFHTSNLIGELEPCG